jgi:hypothetical protein
LSQRDPIAIAKHFAASGFFKDARGERGLSQAVVKIVAGEEMGLGPMASMQGITMIEGKLGFMGNLVATLVRQHPTVDYKVVERTNEKCILDFYEYLTPEAKQAKDQSARELLGRNEFTVEDARQAGLVKAASNWEKYPRPMCFNRCITEGVRALCPEVTAGTPAYTAEELGAEVNEDGEVVSVPNLDADQPAGESADAEVVDTPDTETVTVITERAESVAAINLILGSLGEDAVEGEDVATAAANLTADQATAVLAELSEPTEPDRPALDQGVVDGLMQGIGFLGLDLEKVNAMVVDLGFRALDPTGLPAALYALSEDEASKLTERLQSTADAASEGAGNGR